MTEYTCSKCGKGVSVSSDGIKRPCNCDAPVIASIKAVARGAGGVK